MWSLNTLCQRVLDICSETGFDPLFGHCNPVAKTNQSGKLHVMIKLYTKFEVFWLKHFSVIDQKLFFKSMSPWPWSLSYWPHNQYIYWSRPTCLPSSLIEQKPFFSSRSSRPTHLKINMGHLLGFVFFSWWNQFSAQGHCDHDLLTYWPQNQ